MGTSGLGPDPLFVDRLMIEELRPMVDDVVEVVVSKQAQAKGMEGMQCTDMERVAAQRMLNVAAHQETADALEKSLSNLI
jgi:ABC-type molybdenum transport system ATPase subunit/photorepair protein PhrA